MRVSPAWVRRSEMPNKCLKQKASAAVPWMVLRKRGSGAPLVSEEPLNTGGWGREKCNFRRTRRERVRSGDAVPSAPYDPDLSRWRSCWVVVAG